MKKIIVVSIIVMLILIGISGCTYYPNEEKILNHLSLNDNYRFISLDSDFVSNWKKSWKDLI